MSWLKRFFCSARMDCEADAELRHHFELMVAERMRWGMTEDEARRAARLEFGGHEQLMENCRESRGTTLVTAVLQDLRFAVRQLLRDPSFAFVAIITLALGIGPNTAIFTVVNAVLLRPLPYADSDRLVTWRQNESLLDVDDIRAQSAGIFSAGGAVNPEPMEYSGSPEPLGIHAAFVDAGFFDVLGVPTMLGRVLSPGEDVKGGPRVVVLAWLFWREHFSSDPKIIGKAITLSGNSYTVIGVMPKSFIVPDFSPDLFVSLWAAYPDAAAERDVHFMRSYWRLKPGVTLNQARAGMKAIDDRLAAAYPDDEKGRESIPVSLQAQVTGGIRPALNILFASVCAVLLIACANFAGLLTARGVTRRAEMVVRAALGASRRRLLSQALTESTLLAFFGGIAGVALARAGTALLVAAKPAALAHLNGITMDSRVLLFGIAISVLTGFIFGAAPAWNASRTEITPTLKRESRTVTAGLSIRKLLVAVQLALAVILLSGAGLLIRSFARLRFVDPGFNPAQVTVVPISLPTARYAEVATQTFFRQQVLENLNALPGVEAAMVGDVPFDGNEITHTFAIEHSTLSQDSELPEADTFGVQDDYFHAMQIPIRSGRTFNGTDRDGHPLVVVINEALAHAYFHGANPVGRRFRWARDTDPTRWMTVVGVVADVKQYSLAEPAFPAVFLPFAQSNEAWRGRWISVVVRSSARSANLLPAIKHEIWSVDNRLPLDHIESMEALLGHSLSERRFDMFLLSLFAGLAMILSAVGVYSVMAYSVSQRTHEIGIRMAVGARRGDMVRMILGQGARVAVIGLAIGLGGAFALTRVMKSLLFEVAPNDTLTMMSVTLAIVAFAFLACYIPARRAARVEPMDALRYE
jgi:predicted permease